MKIENNTLVLGTHECRRCDENNEVRETEYLPCRTCKGTGRGPRGGRDGCKECRGLRRRSYDTGRMIPCENCSGTGQEPDDFYDRVPDEIWQSLDFRVHRNPRRAQTFVEAHIGVGCWSVTDYGQHKNMSDEALIQKVRDDHTGGVQACKIIKHTGSSYKPEDPPDPTLPDHIGIFTNDNGYFVAAVHGETVKVRA